MRARALFEDLLVESPALTALESLGVNLGVQVTGMSPGSG